MRAFSTDIPTLPSLRRRTQARREEDTSPPRLAVGTLVEGATEPNAPQEPADVPITHVMTTSVMTLHPDAPAHLAHGVLRSRGIHGAPVVDVHRRIVGMVSRGDLSRAIQSAGNDGGITVGDAMTCFAFALPSRASLGQAAALMAYEGVHRCVVTDDEGRVVGLVSTLDIARWVGERSGYVGLLGRSNA